MMSMQQSQQQRRFLNDSADASSSQDSGDKCIKLNTVGSVLDVFLLQQQQQQSCSADAVLVLVSRVLIVWQIKRQGNIRTNLQSYRIQSSCSQRGISQKFVLQRFILCALSIGFRLVIKCRCLFVCLFGWVGMIHQSMKFLGKIYRTEKYLVHWAMESRKGHNKLINGYGISKGKSNLAAGSFFFWNGMNINDLEREV